LVEMRARDAADAQEAEEHRAEELNRWHTDDHADETADVDEDTVGYKPAGYDPVGYDPAEVL
uniref:hypothetical protein n=1 Tax=Pseudonocardia nigra TaxID=1921578 RepID=UPI001C5E1DE7